jgi:hypothetical protein
MIEIINGLVKYLIFRWQINILDKFNPIRVRPDKEFPLKWKEIKQKS